jgi:hypothetical protein
MKKKKIYCPSCQKAYLPTDQVVLNRAHTVLHMDCPDKSNQPYIDEGTFEEIVKKYSFFDNRLLK